jgi:predicted ribosome quality control (RQC) complex YloA/Tae2 family protein
MQISLNFMKSVQENAAIYFEKAKKAKKKKEGAEKALIISKKKLDATRAEKELAVEALEEQIKNRPVQRKKQWYEKFRWFYSSTGLLVIGGRDVVTNEIVIKKHMEKGDLVMHTDMQGSPFFVIKSEGKPIDEPTKVEAAAATAIFSRAWKLGFVNAVVRAYKPEQVTKTAKHGEYLTRGAFMLEGKGEVIEHDMRCGIGVKEGIILSGPLRAVAEHATIYVEVVQGDDKPSILAKKLKKLFSAGTPDEIIRMLPAGNGKIKT